MPKKPLNFKPSNHSEVPSDATLATLAYIREAVKLLESDLEENGAVPAWVQAKIRQSALNLGMAFSYTQKRKAKK